VLPFESVIPRDLGCTTSVLVLDVLARCGILTAEQVPTPFTGTEITPGVRMTLTKARLTCEWEIISLEVLLQPNIPPSPSGPHTEYTRRLELRRAAVTALARREQRVADLRLVLFGVGGLMAYLSFGPHLFSAWLLILPLLAFAGLVIFHDQLIQRKNRARRSVRFYEQGLARLEDRWAGTGVSGERFLEAAHPYAVDLDLFGSGSLFELLCTARTRAGEETLAKWLCAPATPAVIAARQAAVEELRSRIDLREDLALLGEAVRGSVDVDAVDAWGSAPVVLRGKAYRVVVALLSIATGAAAIAWLSDAGSGPLLVMLLIGQAVVAPYGSRVRRVVRDVDRPARDLALFASFLHRLEQERYESPLLRELAAGFEDATGRPSVRLARLRWLVSVLQAQRNGVFALTGLGLFLLWSTQLAFAIEAWRAECGPLLARWITAVGEFEALSALAGYAYEHPADPFPRIEAAGPLFEAEGLGHPLLPAAGNVRNDLRLDPDRQLLMISGSNMSGKSTFLRSVGINTVLALAGAPVRARRLTVSPLNLGASIRVQDSLQQGISHFYAEILRLRQVVDLSRGDLPLLFLLDEILHGTNSHDRRIGAEAVIRTLVRSGALGLVTTHDLALARIVEDPELHAANGHFQDTILDGRIAFDYRLQPGVVTKSNAIELMRSVGLDV